MLFLVYKLSNCSLFLVLFFDTCTVFLTDPLLSGQVCCNISHQLPCCPHQTTKSRLHFGFSPHTSSPPIASLLFTRCFKGSDFQHIKLMQKKKKKCVAFTTESSFGNHCCWEMGKIWMYKACFFCQWTAFYKLFSYNIEELPFLV